MIYYTYYANYNTTIRYIYKKNVIIEYIYIYIIAINNFI